MKVVHLAEIEGHTVGKDGLLWKPLRHTLGVENFNLWVNKGGAIPQAEVLRSMETIAKHVIPGLQEAEQTPKSLVNLGSRPLP